MYFRNEYYFLSNMYPCNIIYKGYTFKSAESLYQALKCTKLNDFIAFTNLNGYEAKKFGRKIELRSDWNSFKIKAMKIAIFNKFEQNLDLLNKLLAVEEPIIEENTWKDTFWGICNGVGQNQLGKILSAYREYKNK